MTIPHLALTMGEPAGIGPDLCVQIAQHEHNAVLIAIADPYLLNQRARQLQLPLNLIELSLAKIKHLNLSPCKSSQLYIIPHPAPQPVTAGELNCANVNSVIESLSIALQGIQAQYFDAIVTNPVHKGIINDSGYSFCGHTEFFANQTQTKLAVMMLASPKMKIALATTHIPLRQVADTISEDRLTATLEVIHNDLQSRFGIKQPHIAVAGLNPHAGENGYLGTEEEEIIIPTIEKLQRQGLSVTGPFPADTLFTETHLRNNDVILAMYHDQGLPVIKSQCFSESVNVTLGLPFVRTSVDHGTALTLAGTGKTDVGSLQAAITMATDLCR